MMLPAVAHTSPAFPDLLVQALETILRRQKEKGKAKKLKRKRELEASDPVGNSDGHDHGQPEQAARSDSPNRAKKARIGIAPSSERENFSYPHSGPSETPTPNSKLPKSTKPMEFNEIPDDIFIEIFVHVSSPADLSSLVRACRRFCDIGRGSLLRELRWVREGATWNNLGAWCGRGGLNGLNGGREEVDADAEDAGERWNALTLPRKVIVGIGPDFGGRGYYGFSMTPEKRLHDAIHTQLPRFSLLYTLVFENTTISVHTYTVLSLIHTLRHLSIINCTYIRLATSFAAQIAGAQGFATTARMNEPRIQWGGSPTFWGSGVNVPTEFDFAGLPIMHLTLEKLCFVGQGDGERHEFHPLHLILARNLRSLKIMWTPPVAVAYAHSGDLSARVLENVEELDVSMPILTRDLVDSLVGFVGCCTIPGGPRVKLVIERHNFSDQHIGSVQVPIKGVWSYEGPLAIARTFLDVDVDAVEDVDEGDEQVKAKARVEKRLRKVVMSEPLELPALLRGLEHLPKSVEALEIRVRKWDVEVLFAVRSLFRDVKELVVRYGSGEFPGDFFVTLGANILFDLPNLATLKLMHDTSCILVTRHTKHMTAYYNNNSHFVGGAPTGITMHTNNYPTFNLAMAGPDYLDDQFPLSDDEEQQADADAEAQAGNMLDRAEVRDYLVGWNRYCKKLRCVQLSTDKWWERKFKGDRWKECR